MTLRKIAGLLAVSGLLIGLVGSGVGAAFTDQVTGTENISVGTFACEIVAPSDGTIAPDKKSVSYTAGPILSSAAGNAPFKFTVKNVGTIPMFLSVSGPTWAGTLDGSFSAMAATLSTGALAPSATALVSTGIQWTALDNADLGDSGSATWTVNCNEYTAVDSANMYPSSTGWYGWSCPGATPKILGAYVTGGDYASLTLWKLGASVGAVNYPNTPFGYTYTSPTEEGAIVQNDNDSGEVQVLHLFCGF